MSKHTYLATFLDKTLLIISLKSFSDAVFVPTSPGQHTFFPQIVILVLFGYFSQSLLHKLLMCNIFHLVYLLGCYQILLQIMCLFLRVSYPFHWGIYQLLVTISPFYLRIMFPMFPGVGVVSSVARNLSAFPSLVLKLIFPYELANVWQVPLSGRVLYIFAHKFLIWSFVKLVQMSFG